ncbi:MAG: hypothetical protein ACLUAL_12455 [Blautia wexlerae]
MFVTDVGVNTVNGDTLVKMQTLEAPKTALDIAIDNLWIYFYGEQSQRFLLIVKVLVLL